jgi:ABC-type oligopeptide transport system substrate-binding subunit
VKKEKMKKRLELEGVVLAAIMMVSIFVAITPIVSANGVEYWAVIAGVSDYADPSIPDLSYSDDDANDIYDSLLNYDNWEANNIMLLIDSDATKANIHGAIDWMKTNADDNDICLFFFSGHGGWSEDVPPFDE